MPQHDRACLRRRNGQNVNHLSLEPVEDLKEACAPEAQHTHANNTVTTDHTPLTVYTFSNIFLLYCT